MVFPAMLAQDGGPQEGYRVKKVVIDAGHGGKDPGTLGRYSKEKDIALAIALKLGKYIEENIKDVEVIYTRDKDVFVELHKRGDIANKAHADLFISIHCNSNPNKNITGAETYVMGIDKNNRNMEVVKKENDVITLEANYKQHYEGFDPNDPVSMISFNMTQNVYRSQSLEFASLVQDQFRHRAGRHDRGVRQAMFLVLWKTYMPSVLVETGFLSNAREESYLRSENGQAIIASAIYRAFKEYKARIESRSNFTFAEQDTATAWLGVQVMASAKKIPTDYRKFRNYSGVTEIYDGRKYKYIIGRTQSLTKAKELRSKLVKPFPGAFVVGVKSKKIIPLDEALKEINR
jgi:N-acetylmuramoyl-L-alanine amidase